MEKKQIINQAINSLISGAYLLVMMAITLPIWHFWLVGPWLSILGLTDEIENYSFLVGSLVEMVPAIPLWILGIVIHEKVMTKFFRNVEQLGDGYMKKETKTSLIYKVIIFVIWSTTVTIVMYLWVWWSESLLSIFGLTDHALYLLIFSAPFLLLGSAVHKYVKKIYRGE